jgi:hypothetical protein
MALTKAQLIDLNGNELILDLDADTSITADTDISGETAEIQAICNAVWTDAVKAAYIAQCKVNLGG